ncbi:MAG: hypothetical protein AAGA96_20560 [Verrucomicrobiota bacterium]
MRSFFAWLILAMALPPLLGCVAYNEKERVFRVYNNQTREPLREATLEWRPGVKLPHFPAMPEPIERTLDENGETRFLVPIVESWLHIPGAQLQLLKIDLKDGGEYQFFSSPLKRVEINGTVSIVPNSIYSVYITKPAEQASGHERPAH